MTLTGRWLENSRTEIRRGRFIAVVLLTLGALLLVFAGGVGLARVGVYRQFPVAVLVGWSGAIVVLVIGGMLYRRWISRVDASSLATSVELLGGLRRGSVAGVTVEPASGSPSLIHAADQRVAAWLGENGRAALRPVRQRGARSLWLGALVGFAGVSVFALTGPTNGQGAAFWHPFAVVSSLWAPLTVTVDRETVRRGDAVIVTITAPGRQEVSLATRSPGESWQTQPLVLDSLGQAVVSLGPLEVDLFVRAVSGRRSSRTVHVEVALPAFLADLSLTARFPAYLERGDERMFAGDSVLLPAGTQIMVRGQATVPLASAGWRVDGGELIELATEGSEFDGRTAVFSGGEWRLWVTPADGIELDEPPQILHVTVVQDSVPIVSIPVPGVDTIVPPSLLQSLVIDVRDDHLVTKVELKSRRVSRFGLAGDTVVEVLFLPVEGADRAVLPWVLDLNRRDFVPGDTAYYRVRAFDNAPNGQWGESREFRLRLPSRDEMRSAVRDAATELADRADSLFQAQQDLTEETENLASQTERAEEGRTGDEQGLEFRSAEEAGAIREEQSQLADNAQELAEQLEQLAQEAWEAGVNDPEWQKQLEELQQLLEQAVTPEMEEALKELTEALERLDAEAVREALERLNEAQEQFREELERSKELFERAALEAAMSTLADEAEDLAERQEEWNRSTEDSSQSDSSLAAGEREMAQDAEEMRQQLEQLQQAMENAQRSSEAVEEAQRQAGEASQQMQQAASQAQQGQRQEAQQSGQQASEQLDPMASELREQLEQMRQEMRDEVLGMMDQALTETADLARQQEELANRMEQGESGADVRGQQAALRESVDRVIERLQDAAGKNALVSPNLSTALGFSRLKMSEALSQFEQATPNTRQAAEMAGQAVDGLNAVAAALMRNRGDVEGSSSGSGMAEAMQQMAEMAAQQEAMNGQTGAMMPLMQQGGEQVQQQLQEIARQERSLAEELERLGAQEGLPGGTEELAAQAEEIARELEAGRLDAETLERQEQLFRRLLDAGRSLRSDDEDERLERESRTAMGDNVRTPQDLGPDAFGAGPHYPYPRWEQLRQFTPEERRLILDYFRRLNAGRR